MASKIADQGPHEVPFNKRDGLEGLGAEERHDPLIDGEGKPPILRVFDNSARLLRRVKAKETCFDGQDHRAAMAIQIPICITICIPLVSMTYPSTETYAWAHTCGQSWYYSDMVDMYEDDITNLLCGWLCAYGYPTIQWPEFRKGLSGNESLEQEYVFSPDSVSAQVDMGPEQRTTNKGEGLRLATVRRAIPISPFIDARNPGSSTAVERST
ncbi:hypothetical protein NOR_08182 [Metarhizium rileyi]|uniref:Uncharacterized protein n=1 Tax=Metarhizium rileyi (strain RCEF 4871) TaxID=1649241 RepID=A0A166WP27_METRR|nr:hypothetical protein NOR_08182 [Metarhizium rileyi RCEF 4871]